MDTTVRTNPLRTAIQSPAPADVDLPLVEGSGAGLAMIAALAIWVVDLCTANVNLSVLYPLTVFLFARSGRRIATWWYTLGVAALALSGYLLGRWPQGMHTWGEMLTNFRVVNRLLGVAATAAVAWTIKVSLRLEAQMRLRRRETLHADAEQPVYDEIVRAFEQFSAVVLSAVLTIAITTADLISPMEINLPILYAMPLVACLWARKTTMVWILLPILLACSLLGYRWGPPGHVDSAIPYVLRNRMIAAVVISIIGLGVHIWIRTHGNGRSAFSPPRARTSGD